MRSKLPVKSLKQKSNWWSHQGGGYKKYTEKHVGFLIMCLLEAMNEKNGCLRLFPGSHKDEAAAH